MFLHRLTQGICRTVTNAYQRRIVNRGFLGTQVNGFNDVVTPFVASVSKAFPSDAAFIARRARIDCDSNTANRRPAAYFIFIRACLFFLFPSLKSGMLHPVLKGRKILS